MIITISGKPCSGKSTIARGLVDKYGFERISVGDIFKEEAKKRNMSSEEFNAFLMNNPDFDYVLDQHTAQIGKEREGEKVIFDSRCAWHFVPKSFKVFVDLDEDEMTKRLVNSDREGKEKYTDPQEAKRSLLNRRRLENERYKKIYNIDIEDLSNFDYVLNSSNKTPDELVEELWTAYNEFCEAEQNSSK